MNVILTGLKRETNTSRHSGATIGIEISVTQGRLNADRIAQADTSICVDDVDKFGVRLGQPTSGIRPIEARICRIKC